MVGKKGNDMTTRALKRSKTPAQDRLLEMFEKLVHESISSMSLEEARATMKKFDKTIAAARARALASPPRRRKTR